METLKHALFSWKLLVLLAIIILAVSFLFAVIHPPTVYAGESSFNKHGCSTFSMLSYNDCRFNIIEEKIDWNNCILIHKEAQNYKIPRDYTMFGQTEEHLINICGKQP